MSASDTIFALSSGSLPSGIAVIRLSGPLSRKIAERLLGRLPTPRRLTYGALRIDDQILDQGMVVWFPGPNSATGEDCAEIHLHGSVAVAKAAQRWLSTNGVRLAEPGEYTLRGFHNGRYDLTAVEALSDLVAAETETQRQHALGGMQGSIRDACMEWRRSIQTLRAGVEAELDFSDQDDVPEEDQTLRRSSIDGLIGEMQVFVERLSAAEIVRRGYRVAILGAPNAGKSSLINALAMRDVAIVTAEPGTTRDLVEVTLELGGQKVILTDTAGIREADSEAEQLGIIKAKRAAADAELVLSLSAPMVPAVDVATQAQLIRIGAKSDLGRLGDVDISISVRTGDGLPELLELIESRAALRIGTSGGIPLRERHTECLKRGLAELMTARDARRAEIAAEHLRRAAVEIGRVVGIGDTEELLGEIFARFCIGK